MYFTLKLLIKQGLQSTFLKIPCHHGKIMTRICVQGDTDVGGMQAAFRATQKILSCEYDIPKNVPLSAELKDLIARIFVADPKRRIDSYDLTKHPW